MSHDSKMLHYNRWRYRTPDRLDMLRVAVQESRYEVDSQRVAECLLLEHFCVLFERD